MERRILCAGDFNHDLVLSIEDVEGMIDWRFWLTTRPGHVA